MDDFRKEQIKRAGCKGKYEALGLRCHICNPYTRKDKAKLNKIVRSVLKREKLGYISKSVLPEEYDEQ